jgi:hypothetical protein
LPQIRWALRLSLCLAVCTSLLSAQTNVPQPQTAATVATAAPEPHNTWLELLWSLPVFNWFAPQSVEPAAPPMTTFAPPPPLPHPGMCPVAPLPPITDPQAEAFNNGESLDTAGLTSGMARALARFQQIVNRMGGSFELKSAYRPPSYQLHLQQVWDKWMALRNNQNAACQDLRAGVREEFARHHLLETQRPVNSSDHTRGLAFDATVILPSHPRIKRRRKVTLDALARQAGLRRPDILHDPVHFKFVGGKLTRA